MVIRRFGTWWIGNHQNAIGYRAVPANRRIGTFSLTSCVAQRQASAKEPKAATGALLVTRCDRRAIVATLSNGRGPLQRTRRRGIQHGSFSRSEGPYMRSAESTVFLSSAIICLADRAAFL
jgi:hypothetical protein